MFDLLNIAKVGEQAKAFFDHAAHRLDQMEAQQAEILRLVRELERRSAPINQRALQTDTTRYLNERSI